VLDHLGSGAGFADLGDRKGFREDGTDPGSHQQICIAYQGAYQVNLPRKAQFQAHTLQYVS
jgi:hypothetical protein